MANEFDTAAAAIMGGQAQNLRNNVYGAVTQNPAQVSQHDALARDLGVPIDTVQADPEGAKQQLAMQSFDADKMVRDFPHLARFISTPINAAKSHDDLPTLGATEQAVKAMPQPSPSSAPPTFDDKTPVLSAWEGPAASFTSVLSGLVKSLPQAFERVRQGVRQQWADTLGFDEMGADAARKYGQAVSATDASTPVFQSSAGRWLYGGASGLVQAAPGIAAAAVNPLLGLAAFGAQADADAYGKYRARGATAAQATTGSALEGAVTAGASMLPVKYLVDRIGHAGMGEFITGLLARDLPTMEAQTIATSAIDTAIANPDTPWSDWAKGLPEELAQGGVSALMFAGAGGLGHVVAKMADSHAAAEGKAIDAARGMQSLQTVTDLAARANLLKIDPGAYHDFIKSVTDDGHLPEVWIDGNTLANTFAQSGIQPERVQQTMPDIFKQMHEAGETGGLVRISTPDLLTHLSDPAISDKIIPELKVDPEGMTFAEGQKALDEQRQTMGEEAQTSADEKLAKDAREGELDSIARDTQAQIEQTGRYTTEQAKQYAALHRAFYDTMAEREGMTPAEMRERMPLTIGAEGASGYGQGERGSFNPDTGAMTLSKDADLSTFLHESGHFFLEAMHDLASQPEASAGVKQDFDTLLQHFGVEGATPDERMGNWSARDLEAKRPGHEQFADGFENYLMTGKAPTPELQSLFGRFRAWLLSVYHTIRGDVSPEVRGVMDRMLASQDAIEQAERARGYLPADFGAQVDPASAAAYRNDAEQATQEAIEDMQARSLRDMRWLNSAQSKAMKALQREARDVRAKITDEVTKGVMAEPVNRARTWLTKGETTDRDGNQIKAEKGYRLNTGDLREMYPKNALGAGDVLADLRGMTSADGLHPDLVAEMFGFNSGRELIGALVNGEKPADKISALTDVRMLEQHGELVDPVSIQRAAEAAIHNEARARMMATGLKILAKSPMSAVEIAKAAKAAADTAVAQKKVGELRPAQYSAAEARANREMLKSAPKDPAAAAKAQREALLNNRLFKSTSDAVDEIRKSLTYLKRFGRDSVRGRLDKDVRDQIDDLLGRFDLRANPTDTPTRAEQNLEQWVESQVAAGLMPNVSPDMLRPDVRMPYREMTVEQFRGMVDSVKSLEEIGKTRNTLMVEGRRVALDQVVREELVPKMREAGQNFSAEDIYTRTNDRGLNDFQIGIDHFMSWLRGVGAELKPQEFKRNFYDRHEILGPFGKYIFERVMDANYRKVDMLKSLSADFEAKAKELGRDWQKSLDEVVPNTKLLDPQLSAEAGVPKPMRITRGKLLMIALHSGNESNFDKLTKGYKWNPADVWSLLSEHLRAEDIAAVNHVHELYERHWPDMVKMYAELGQSAPPKVEARPVDLPAGRLNGGYAHIDYDPLRSRYGQKAGQGQAKEIAEKGVSVGDYFKRTGTTNGAMNARVEGYTDMIDLDHNTIAQALRETIHDLAYRQSLVDVNKILEHPDFKREFKTAYGQEQYAALQTWLGRVANSNNADLNVSKLGKLLQYSRTGMVMNAIALRATTVLKHGGSAGIKTMGYFAGGGEKYLLSRMASMTHDYKNQVQGAIEKFPEIRARLMQQDRDYRSTAIGLFEADPLRAKAERFGHAAVAWADMCTAVPTAWAAYDRAVAIGIPVKQGGTGKPMRESEAIHYASKIVREAHGSNIESARSNIMTEKSEAMKMFTTLYGFMNNTYGQISDSYSKLGTAGINKPAVLARTFMAIIVPSIWAHVLTEGMKKDGESWAGWMAKAIAGEVSGAVPFVRDAAAMVKGYSHAGQVGVESWLQTMVQAGHDIVKIAQGEHGKGKPIQDIANAVGEGLHIPGLGQIGKTAQYYADRANGKVPPPENAMHEVVDPLIGAPHH